MHTDFKESITNPKSLALYEKFSTTPHCTGFAVLQADVDGGELFVVDFKHYSDTFTVFFDVDTNIGEVMINPPHDVIDASNEEVDAHYYGMITVEKLLELLGKMPHLVSFLESESFGEVLH
jgi:hypothetical protein